MCYNRAKEAKARRMSLLQHQMMKFTILLNLTNGGKAVLKQKKTILQVAIEFMKYMQENLKD